MGEKTTTIVSTLKKGRYLIVNDVACRVTDVQISRPGKHGHAKSKIDAVSLIDGQKFIFIKPSHDKIEVPIIEKNTAQVLSVSGDTVNVMDLNNYETFDLKIPSDLKDSVKEGVHVGYWVILDDKVLKEVK